MSPANIKPKYTTRVRGKITRKAIINNPDGGSIRLLSRNRACEINSNHKAGRLFPMRLPFARLHRTVPGSIGHRRAVQTACCGVALPRAAGLRGARLLQVFPHRHEFNPHAVTDVVLDAPARLVPARRVQLQPRERGHQLERTKAVGARLALARRENGAADPFSRVPGVDEEGSDSR